MPISVTCPHCATKLKAPDERAGRRAKCRKCGQKLRVPGHSPAADSSGDLAPFITEEAFDFQSDPPALHSNVTANGKYRPTPAGNPGVKLAVAAVLVGGCVLAAIGAYVIWVRSGSASGSTRTADTRAEAKPAESPTKPEPSKK